MKHLESMVTVKDETVAQLRAELEDEVIQGSYSEMEAECQLATLETRRKLGQVNFHKTSGTVTLDREKHWLIDELHVPSNSLKNYCSQHFFGSNSLHVSKVANAHLKIDYFATSTLYFVLKPFSTSNAKFFLRLKKGLVLFNFLQSASWIWVTKNWFSFVCKCDGFLQCFVVPGPAF